MKRLLSGNEAIALGAFEGGVRYAAAYPGAPSTEILENLATYKGVVSEWASNEKVAFDSALGALSREIGGIDPDVWTTVIQRRVPQKYAELNRVAFWEGRM